VALGRVVREPSNVASPRRPARRYVEEQTLRAFQTLPKRVNRAIGSRSDCNVARETDRVTVAVRGEPVAEINRFVVSVRGNRLWAGDVLGDPATLRAIRAGLADFANSPPAVGDGPSARSDLSRNESERPFETQGEPAPIDERDDRDAVPARVAWPGGVVAFFEAAGMSAHVVAGGIWLEGGKSLSRPPRRWLTRNACARGSTAGSRRTRARPSTEGSRVTSPNRRCSRRAAGQTGWISSHRMSPWSCTSPPRWPRGRRPVSRRQLSSRRGVVGARTPADK
jgi:hypothetical protein